MILVRRWATVIRFACSMGMRRLLRRIALKDGSHGGDRAGDINLIYRP
jgi:hypothetical protein